MPKFREIWSFFKWFLAPKIIRQINIIRNNFFSKILSKFSQYPCLVSLYQISQLKATSTVHRYKKSLYKLITCKKSERKTFKNSKSIFENTYRSEISKLHSYIFIPNFEVVGLSVWVYTNRFTHETSSLLYNVQAVYPFSALVEIKIIVVRNS